ncbi:conserved protein of unknown function [Hyphomicrobium sp. 1Nfss2.1]|uniref:hypothetical protein n=1 Tax=Hyphomicrobium sp. 1Nfss2.1 TaxID=3413936 RepID=UPI003C7AB445
MTLGDLIWRMEDPAVADEAAGTIRDAALLRRLSAAAAAAQLQIGEYVASSVRLFANTAGDEAWITMIGRCQAHSDPGLAALTYMLESRLHADEAQKHR